MKDRKPKASHDDPAQSKRFIDMAREVEADERPEAVDEVFKRVIPQGNDQKLPAAKKDQ
jgi:hypothetical protein